VPLTPVIPVKGFTVSAFANPAHTNETIATDILTEVET
jgi:hypothetical protein